MGPSVGGDSGGAKVSPPEEGQTCHPRAAEQDVTVPAPQRPLCDSAPPSLTAAVTGAHHQAQSAVPLSAWMRPPAGHVHTLPAQPRDHLPTPCCLFLQDPGISNRLQLLFPHPRTPTRASHPSCLPNHSLPALKLSWSWQITATGHCPTWFS